MQRKIKKMFLVLKLIAFEFLAQAYLYYEEKSCHRVKKQS